MHDTHDKMHDKNNAVTDEKGLKAVKVPYNPSECHPFDTINRVRLLQRIIEGRGKNFCGLHLQSLMEKKCLLTHYPLHEDRVVRELADDWLAMHIMPWEQVYTKIDEYS